MLVCKVKNKNKSPRGKWELILRRITIFNASKGRRIHTVNQTRYKVVMFDLGLKFS